MDRNIAVSCQRPGIDQARPDAGLEQFAIPLPVCRARKRSWILSGNHFLYGCLYPLKCLPIPARSERVAVFAVFFVIFRAPVALPDLLDHFRRNRVTLDGQGMICIAFVDFIDMVKI